MGQQKNKITREKKVPAIKPRRTEQEGAHEKEKADDNPMGIGNPPPNKPLQPKAYPFGI